VTSWIRPSPSWRVTEVSTPHSHLFPPAFWPLHCCSFCNANQINHTVHLSIKQNASTSLHNCLFILECVYEANLTKRQKKIYENILIIILRLYLSSFCTKRGVYSEGISVTPKAADGTIRALFSLQCNGWCAGKNKYDQSLTIVFFISMTGSYSKNVILIWCLLMCEIK